MKQGAVLSPVHYCVYYNCPKQNLAAISAQTLLVHLHNADDLVLLALTPMALWSCNCLQLFDGLAPDLKILSAGVLIRFHV